MARSETRTVNAPPRMASTTAQAARWLGWGIKTFRRVVEAENDWLRPIGVKGERGGDLWDWEDLVALRRIYQHRVSEPEKST